jgi:DNA (cytosine-5)-methyltransferase 1
MKHKLLDLFSGIGGFSLGAEANGIPTVAFVEKDPFCQKVLRKHWSNTPIISDIRTVKGEDYETDGVTIVSGGFPCQPFSVAGKQKGTDDDRYLWDETIRVVAETKPEWFIGENVDGIVNIQDGMVLRQVQDDLEKEGFQVQCLVIPASGIGAWHQRKRVWIVGHSQHNGSSTTKEQRGNTQTSTRSQKRENSSLQSEGTSRSRNDGNVSNTIGELSDGRSSTTEHSKPKQEWVVSHSQEYKDKVWGKAKRCDQQTGSRGDVSNTNGERLQGHGVQTNMEVEERQVSSIGSTQGQYTWWQTESKLRGVPHGISYELDKDRANRIKALGNSIVPQIAYQLFKSIVTVTKEDNNEEQVYWC